MKHSTKLFTLIILALFSLSAINSCNKKEEEPKQTVIEPTFNLTVAKAEIVDANKEFMKRFAASDSIGLSNLYSMDAKFMMNGAPAIIGRENIQSTLSSIMASGISSVKLITIDVWGTENFITEEGELSLFIGEDEVDQGKYMVLWKKEDGKWKLFRDIFNSNQAAKN
ncbi:YybH family protein [Snuella sedimenti]|uniref:DUF4440 domain-containing protein n=1 Tax=Snuella sedimenti TaxID=2798802 RepID=A0A8J7IFG4_9FLAO|nr:ketosteroid isomerase family protein [Snuella sedimenti]MBJ6367817.1 DUF4440 domain-containing protein [Snuella sedimenti]